MNRGPSSLSDTSAGLVPLGTGSRASGVAVDAGVGARTSMHRWVQYVLAIGYLGFIVFGLVSPLMPRVFWTMLLPLVVVAIVLMGFPSWRRICPLAFFGEAGRVLDRGVRLAHPRLGRGRLDGCSRSRRERGTAEAERNQRRRQG